MPRCKKKRYIEQMPRFLVFKPAGIPSDEIQTLTMTVDEYEAIRLADGKGLSHETAALKMNISRPTFSRLIEKGRKKMADMLDKGMILQIEGGNICFKQNFSDNLPSCPQEKPVGCRKGKHRNFNKK